MPIVEFLPDKLNQWVLYEKDNYLIWIAGDNITKKYDYLIKRIINNIDIDKDYIKNTIKDIDDHFGIVVIAPNWSFAAVEIVQEHVQFFGKKQKIVI